MKPSAATLVLFSLLLVACGSTPTPTQRVAELAATTNTATPKPAALSTLKPTSTATVIPSPTSSASPIPTNTPKPTGTPRPTPTGTPQPTKTPTPFPTPAPQVLARVFPKGFDSPGVWAHEPSKEDAGYIHFDVGLPYAFKPGADLVVSPASGTILYVQSAGSGEGQVITIRPYPPIQGIPEVVRQYGYDSRGIMDVTFLIGHITPLKTKGEIKAGESLGTAYDGWWNPNKIAFVVTVDLKKGRILQLSPCELPNTFEFCKCYPGTPLGCP